MHGPHILGSRLGSPFARWAPLPSAGQPQAFICFLKGTWRNPGSPSRQSQTHVCTPNGRASWVPRMATNELHVRITRGLAYFLLFYFYCFHSAAIPGAARAVRLLSLLCFRVPVGGAPQRCHGLADLSGRSLGACASLTRCGAPAHHWAPQRSVARKIAHLGYAHAAEQDEADMSLICLDHLCSAACSSFESLTGQFRTKGPRKPRAEIEGGDSPSYLRQWSFGAWPVLACRIDGYLQSSSRFIPHPRALLRSSSASLRR